MTTPRTFRSRDQWQSIMVDFSSSGLSAPKYCEQNNLPYGSFAKWRQKLSGAADASIVRILANLITRSGTI